jgi:predicted SnoaL-like aldol condensation-catalyzing enzyme
MIMKNKLMLLIVVAGVATAVYRFLPIDLQQHVTAQLNTIAQQQPAVASAIANPAQKKYRLDIPDTTTSADSSDASDIVNAYIQHQSDVQVSGQGQVVKLLSDDNKGSRHQRFIVRIEEGLTVLIAHNIDLAPRLNTLAQADNISFYGEYEWNEKGGVVHWTHRDPRGHHPAGWIRHKGVTYQ